MNSHRLFDVADAACHLARAIAARMRMWIAILIGVALGMLFSRMAAAQSISIEGGRSYAGEYFSAPESAPVAFGEVTLGQHPIGATRFSWEPDAIAGWLDGRDIPRYQTARYATRDHIWLLGAGIRLHFGAEDAWYRPFFFSFQPTLHTGRTHSLSSAYEFTSTFGWQMHHWMVAVRHSSNAFLHEPNLGETMLIVGLTFRMR
jgi:Lipid A 3-O-deacylase (PagL)